MWRVPFASQFQSLWPADRFRVEQTDGLDKVGPMIDGRRRRLKLSNCLDRIIFTNAVEQAGGRFRADLVTVEGYGIPRCDRADFAPSAGAPVHP